MQIGPKLKKVLEPNEAAPWKETYCWYVPANLTVLRLNLIVLFIKMMTELIQLSMGSSWYEFYLPEDQQNHSFN